TSLLLRTSGQLLLVRSAAAARARVARVVDVAAAVVEVAAGVVVGAAVEVVAAVGLVEEVGALVAAVEASVGVAAVAEVGLVAVGLELGVFGSGGGQRQQQQRQSETQSPQQLREALHTFTLDSGASRCFFRDSTTLTPLPAPVPVRLADPSGGPVVARSSTVLSVSGGSVQLTVRSLPSLPPSLAPPCLPCVEGRQRTAPHSSFPPTIAPLQTLHMDVWGPARVSGQSRKRYFLLVVGDYTR
ncbi:unnamed protein product, partial [Closterium sp. Naga37s-1]